MVELLLPRRRFLAGLVSLVAAPAVVRIASLKPVRALPFEPIRSQEYHLGDIAELANRHCAAWAAQVRRMELCDMMRLYDSMVCADG